MKARDRKTSARVVLPVGLLVLGLFGGAQAGVADEAKADETSASCREETRRVALPPRGGNPKFHRPSRYEERLVTVCDGKIVSQAQHRDASNQADGRR